MDAHRRKTNTLPYHKINITEGLFKTKRKKAIAGHINISFLILCLTLSRGNFPALW